MSNEVSLIVYFINKHNNNFDFKGVKNFVRERIGFGMYPEDICEELMTHCLAPDCLMGGLGGDNMTVVLVCFLHNKPYDNLISRCETSETLETRKTPDLTIPRKSIWPPTNGSSSETTTNATIGTPRIRKEDSDDDDGDDDGNFDNEPDLK